MKTIVALLGAAALLVLPAALPASPEPTSNFTFVGTGPAPSESATPFDFFDLAHWKDGQQPGVSGGDIVFLAPCVINTDFARLNLRSLTIQNRVRLFARETSLHVSGDASISNGALEIQKDSLVHTAGLLSLGDGFGRGRITLIDGLGKQGAARVRAGEFAAHPGAGFYFRWFYTVPAGLPGNPSPLIETTGTLRLLGPTFISLTLESARPSAYIGPGDYALLGAARIEGDLPSLVVNNAASAPALQYALKFDDARTRLLLQVSPAP